MTVCYRYGAVQLRASDTKENMRNTRLAHVRAVINLSGIDTLEEVLHNVRVITEMLEFEVWRYAVRVPLPASRRDFERWNGNVLEQSVYSKPNIIDATHYINISHLLDGEPKLWSDCVQLRPFLMANDCDNRHGVVTPVWEKNGIFGIFAVEKGTPVTTTDLLNTAAIHEWFAARIHRAFVRVRINEWASFHHDALSEVEIKILQWTADGKSAGLVSEILGISERMVTFHVASSLQKLRASNKTAAVAKALTLGLI